MNNTQNLREEWIEFIKDIRDVPVGLADKTIADWIVSKFSASLDELAGEALRVLGKDQIELNHGKLPFVMFGGKADEQEKIDYYRQGLKDFAAFIKSKQ